MVRKYSVKNKIKFYFIVYGVEPLTKNLFFNFNNQNKENVLLDLNQHGVFRRHLFYPLN